MGWIEPRPDYLAGRRLDGVVMACALREGTGPKVRLRIGEPQVEALWWSNGLVVAVMTGTEADAGKILLRPSTLGWRLHAAGAGLELKFSAQLLPAMPRQAQPARLVVHRILLPQRHLEVRLPSWAGGALPDYAAGRMAAGAA